MAEFTCRQARLDDAGEILSLLLEVAPEIPLHVDSLEREEALYAQIRNCARSGESWVALDRQERIIGFLLAQPVERGRHYAEQEMLELTHAGVRPSHRQRGVFGALLAGSLARLLPITTSVSPLNSCGAAGFLAKRGFRPVGSSGGERRLRWEPGAGC